MRKTLLIIIIIIILILGGVYIVSNQSKSGKNNGDMGNGRTMDDDSMSDNTHTVQSHRSYSFQLTSSAADNLQPDKETKIAYKIIDDQGIVLKNYAKDHTQIMHFIAVRTDLQDFQHLHPEFNKNTGEFTVPVTFPEDGTYRLFADFTPAQGQMGPDGNVLGATSSQDVKVGNENKFKQKDVRQDTQAIKKVEDYELTYSFPQQLEAGKPVSIVVDVKKNGQPVTDMEEYLGAQAHGILLKKNNLEFAHLHAAGATMNHAMHGESMSMNGSARNGPEITFDYTFPQSGIYRLFTQFQHQGKVITSDYTIVVK